MMKMWFLNSCSTFCLVLCLAGCFMFSASESYAQTPNQVNASANTGSKTSASERESEDTAYISAKEAKTAINNIITELNTNYIDVKKAQPAIVEFQSMLKTGRFNSGIHFDDFDTLVQSTVYKATWDSGFELTYSRLDKSAREQARGYDSQISSQIRYQGKSYDIGYLKLSGNYNVDGAIDSFDSAFDMHADVKAFIIDLQDVDEGNFELTQKLLGFFISPDTTVGQVKFSNRIVEIKPTSSPDAKRFSADLPIYIINSGFVAGPWELFSYVMQQQNRAIIVGQLSMGVGFIDNKVKVSDKIFASMTQALYLSAEPCLLNSTENSTTNSTENSPSNCPPTHLVGWNEHGVIPDYSTKPEDNIEETYQLATRQIKR